MLNEAISRGGRRVPGFAVGGTLGQATESKPMVAMIPAVLIATGVGALAGAAFSYLDTRAVRGSTVWNSAAGAAVGAVVVSYIESHQHLKAVQASQGGA
jgi:hypothetical protein